MEKIHFYLILALKPCHNTALQTTSFYISSKQFTQLMNKIEEFLSTISLIRRAILILLL